MIVLISLGYDPGKMDVIRIIREWITYLPE